MKPGPKTPPEPLYSRFMKRTVIVQTDKFPTPCWIWTGPVDPKGYGKTVVGSRQNNTRRTERVHLAAYREIVGPVGEGLTLDHMCEMKTCWNPEHLDECTNAENKRRARWRAHTCRRGHLRTEESVYIRPNGKLQCRLCRKLETLRPVTLTSATIP